MSPRSQRRAAGFCAALPASGIINAYELFVPVAASAHHRRRGSLAGLRPRAIRLQFLAARASDSGELSRPGVGVHDRRGGSASQRRRTRPAFPSSGNADRALRNRRPGPIWAFSISGTITPTRRGRRWKRPGALRPRTPPFWACADCWKRRAGSSPMQSPTISRL